LYKIKPVKAYASHAAHDVRIFWRASSLKIVGWKGNFLLGKIRHSRQFGQGHDIEVI
jgi:hypothetical protein